MRDITKLRTTMYEDLLYIEQYELRFTHNNAKLSSSTYEERFHARYYDILKS